MHVVLVLLSALLLIKNGGVEGTTLNRNEKARREYSDGGPISILVDRFLLSSSNRDSATGAESASAGGTSVHDYENEYYNLPVCHPRQIMTHFEGFHDVLAARELQSTPYEVKFLQEETCKVLCRRVFTRAETDVLRNAIDKNDTVSLFADDLPAATHVLAIPRPTVPKLAFDRGYFLGGKIRIQGPGDHTDEDPLYYLNNHLVLTLFYNDQANAIVRFNVEAFSIRHQSSDSHTPLCSTRNHQRHFFEGGGEEAQLLDASDSVVTWTYDVRWQPSSIRFESRYDAFIPTPPTASPTIPFIQKNEEVVQEYNSWFSAGSIIALIIAISTIMAAIILLLRYSTTTLLCCCRRWRGIKEHPSPQYFLMQDHSYADS